MAVKASEASNIIAVAARPVRALIFLVMTFAPDSKLLHSLPVQQLTKMMGTVHQIYEVGDIRRH